MLFLAKAEKKISNLETKTNKQTKKCHICVYCLQDRRQYKKNLTLYAIAHEKTNTPMVIIIIIKIFTTTENEYKLGLMVKFICVCVKRSVFDLKKCCCLLKAHTHQRAILHHHLDSLN